MTYDYDKLYGDTPDALGEPTTVFVNFFDQFDQEQARVLDVGCGQGRDAIFIARRGHSVVGVDISPNGIRDLVAVAKAENLAIRGIVADLSSYTPDGDFDVILVDRTLHMLGKTTRLSVLTTLLEHTRPGGWMLIADEISNIADFETVLTNHTSEWKISHKKRGYLFARRD